MWASVCASIKLAWWWFPADRKLNNTIRVARLAQCSSWKAVGARYCLRSNFLPRLSFGFRNIVIYSERYTSAAVSSLFLTQSSLGFSEWGELYSAFCYVNEATFGKHWRVSLVGARPTRWLESQNFQSCPYPHLPRRKGTWDPVQPPVARDVILCACCVRGRFRSA